MADESADRRRAPRKAKQLPTNGQGLHDQVKPPAACASWPPSATRAGASTTSCAAAPAARATRVRQPLLPEPGRPADAHLRGRPRARHHGPAEDARGRGHRGRHRQPQHRKRAAQGRGAQLRHPQAAARVRRRQQRPAQGHLPAAQRDPGSRGAGRADPQPAPRRDDRRGAHPRAGRHAGRAVGPGRAGEGAEGRVAARGRR
jgi:hypothetical protein